jgi:hypothetical protein
MMDTDQAAMCMSTVIPPFQIPQPCRLSPGQNRSIL